MTALTLDLRPVIRLTHQQFKQIALANQDLRLELTAAGELVLMPPTGGNTGRRNSDLTYQLKTWNRRSKLGVMFASSTVFRLPNGAERSPDVRWVQLERWQALTPAEQDAFPPLCPDFVVELRSRTDRLQPLQAKLQDYLANGCSLGWLINVQDRQVELYRPDRPVDVMDAPTTLSGEAILPGLSVSTAALW